jgi:hypothetical protein
MVALRKPRVVKVLEEDSLANGLAAIDWAASGTRLRVISPDVSGLARRFVPNASNRVRPMAVQQDIPTLKHADLSFEVNMHGSPGRAAEGAQATTTSFPIATLAKNAMGGLYKGYAIGFAGGTSSAPIVDDATNLGVGDYQWCKQTSTGLGHFYRVIAKPGGNVLQFDRPLHFTPVAADVAHAVLDLYWDQAVITNYDHADHETLAMMIAGEHDSDVYVARGMKLAMKIKAIAPGNQTRLIFKSLVTTFSTIAKPTISGTLYGEAASVPGTADTLAMFCSDAAGELDSITVGGAVNLSGGITYARVPGLGGIEGVLGHVATGFEAVELQFAVHFDASWIDDYAARTDRQILLEVGAKLSQLPWAVHYPQLELRPPTRDPRRNQTSLLLTMRARENQASAAGLTGQARRKWQAAQHLLVAA